MKSIKQLRSLMDYKKEFRILVNFIVVSYLFSWFYFYCNRKRNQEKKYSNLDRIVLVYLGFHLFVPQDRGKYSEERHLYRSLFLPYINAFSHCQQKYFALGRAAISHSVDSAFVSSLSGHCHLKDFYHPGGNHWCFWCMILYYPHGPHSASPCLCF